MNFNAINLALRFVLELAALAAMAYWGWTTHEGIWQPVWATGLPVVAAFIWGTFRVPGAPGKAPVPVPGPVRLLLELVFFAAAVWLLAAAGQQTAALIFGTLIVLHYLAFYETILWMLKQR